MLPKADKPMISSTQIEKVSLIRRSSSIASSQFSFIILKHKPGKLDSYGWVEPRTTSKIDGM